MMPAFGYLLLAGATGAGIALTLAVAIVHILHGEPDDQDRQQMVRDQVRLELAAQFPAHAVDGEPSRTAEPRRGVSS